MGMYDTIVSLHTCPKCGRESESYQTKEFGQDMDTYRPGDRVYVRDGAYEAHDYCRDCKYLWSIRVSVVAGVLAVDHAPVEWDFGSREKQDF